MRYLVILLLFVSFSASAQTTRPQVQVDPAKPDPASLAARQDALLAAEQVIDQLSEIEDLRTRVELADKIVRLLVKSRPERLRKMLTTIFEDAISLKTQPSKTKSAPRDLDSILHKVIQTAALIDTNLARSYIEALANLKAADETASSAPNSSVLYLKIATELSRSNPSLAVEVATGSLTNGIVPETLLFLVTLREVDVAAANRFFLTALQSCQARGAKDINELLLLYAYVFSPLKVPIVTPQGLAVLNIGGYSEVAKNYEIDDALARRFLQALIETLLNPLRYTAGNIETLTLGPDGDFYALTIAEPWVATYEPRKVSAVSEQRDTIITYMQASRRDAAASAFDRWKNTPASNLTSGVNETAIESLVKKAETAPDPKHRDQLYFRAALMAVRLKKPELALNLVDKLSADYSDRAKQFVRFDIALQDINNQQFVEADKLARMDDVLARRAYIFTLIADKLAQGKQRDPSRALQYLEEVQQLAGKLSNEKEKLSVLIGAGNVYARLDNVRASEIFQQVIKQANKVQDFVGDSSISNMLEIGDFYFDYSLYSNALTIFELVRHLASVSYYATLQDIRSLKNPALRVHAIVALCSGVIPDENQARDQ